MRTLSKGPTHSRGSGDSYLLDFEQDIPTTRQDIEAQRVAAQMPQVSLREYLERFAVVRYPFAIPSRLTTFEGCAPIEL